VSRRSHDFQSPLMRQRMAVGIDQARFAFLISLTPNVLSKVARGVRDASPNEAQRIEAALSELETAHSRARSRVAELMAS
jgi:DNA-binding transcriptional regulator YdaS (Cro superfamily)